MTVEKILLEKGTLTPTIAPDADVAEAIDRLAVEDVGALVVSSDGSGIEGIISERDIVRGLRDYGAKMLGHPIRDLMTPDVFTCAAEDSVSGVMALMDAKRIRHVPVLDDERLAGIVTIRDIVKLRLDEVQAEADAMREYIAHA